MFARRQATVEANREAEAAARQHRTDDEFEKAKRFLQSRGYTVFSNKLVTPGCPLIAVGQRTMTKEEAVAFAERIRARLCR